jgi:AcrR family transcriptional regulator
VFATRGYHGGSLRDIARELDLSLTSIVHHYNTKYWDSPKIVKGSVMPLPVGQR